MIGRGPTGPKPLVPEELVELFRGSALGSDVVASIKARFFPDDEVEIRFSRNQGRIQLAVTKDGKVFRIFEDYLTSYFAPFDLATALLKALRDKAPAIQAYSA
jgi:hypothetical protein